MFDWVLNTPLLPVKNKETNYLIWKKLKLYSSFLLIGFNCIKATEPLRGDSLFFYPSVPRSSWYLISQFRKNKRLRWPWSHPVVLNSGFLNWESRSTLTTRIIGKMYVKCQCPLFINIKQIFHYKEAIE